ncbi:unnamed protein product [Linum trigynum]|uniref:Uncharacterized protein n=1 Tax=Linum trigynum TaxID=586398 RepID=A0AAV2FTP8_9ROSI
MKSKGSKGKRAQAPISSSNVLNVSEEAECDDVGMDSSSGEEMKIENYASTSKVAASDHIGSASTHIESPMPKGRRLSIQKFNNFVALDNTSNSGLCTFRRGGTQPI